MRTVKYIKADDNCQDSRNLEIDHVLFYKDKDYMLVILNNGDIIKAHMSDYPFLKDATTKQLEAVEIIGSALYWRELDEDLSLPGFFRDAAIFGSIDKIESIKYDPRPCNEKVIFMCFYINIDGLSRQRIDEELRQLRETCEHMSTKYKALFKSFDDFYVPVQNKETSIEIFVL